MPRRAASSPASDDVVRRRLAALADQLAADRGEDPGAGTRPEAASEPRGGGASVAGGRHARATLPAGRRLRGWLLDRVPTGLRGTASLGSAQIGLLALVVATGVLVGAWWFVRSAGEPEPVAAPSVVATSPGDTLSPPTGGAPLAAGSSKVTGPGAPAASGPALGADPPAAGDLVVDVVGKVRRPGVVVLPAGSRVTDAVEAAGGLRRGVDRRTVNLARPLTDGEQLLVGAAPRAGPPAAGTGSSSGASATPAGLVNLNAADQAALETLPRVGPVTAAAILQWRAEHGAFTAVEELLAVSGIGEATLAQIAPHVTL